MRLAVISCWAYRDAWAPFFALLDKFWPNHPSVTLIADVIGRESPAPLKIPTFQGPESRPWSWCEVLTAYARTIGDEPLLLMQEDFFLTAPVQEELIASAVKEFDDPEVGCVRLYPCPGGSGEGSEHFGIVPRGTRYRISCQAALWRPSFLVSIARHCSTAFRFEVMGTHIAKSMPQTVLAFRHELRPWPMEYLCTAINRGRWTQDAKRICDQHSISADWSMRAFHPA